jgi:hypothetical protein
LSGDRWVEKLHAITHHQGKDIQLDKLRQWRSLSDVEFVRLPTFEKTVTNILSESDIFELELILAVRPDAGDLIPGGRGLRKLRRPAKGHGKRGGARVIYYHVSSQHIILLIVAYAKNEQEDLDRKQLQILATLVKSEFP